MKKLIISAVCGLFAIGAGAATLNVPTIPYPTIPDAVNAAGPGDTIVCAPGNYAKIGNINKPLTLLGAQAGVDARDGRPAAPESVITGGGLSVCYLNATDITIDGFTFSNMKHRTLDTYFDADNFTMRNCILLGNSGNYYGGSIQFGGGLNLHANGLLFEQNLVLVDNGTMLYMGHAMDNGTIRNNKFNGDTATFGPFGDRTGWLIEGNEFDGNVPGHGAYWGFAFNANLGDVVIRNNIVSQMVVGIGQISVVGGSVTDNVFTDNWYGALQLWGGEWGSVVSDNATITDNTFFFNGAADGNGYAIRLRPDGIDASTVHINRNDFIDMGAVAGVYAINNQGHPDTTLDALCNWWGTTDPEVIAPYLIGSPADFTPFEIASGGPCVNLGALCVAKLKIGTKADKNKVEIKGNMVLGDVDLTAEDVNLTITDAEADALQIDIPAGSFVDKGKQKWEYKSPQGVDPKVKFTIDFEEGTFKLEVKELEAHDVNGSPLDITLLAGDDYAQQTVLNVVKKNELKYDSDCDDDDDGGSGSGGGGGN